MSDNNMQREFISNYIKQLISEYRRYGPIKLQEFLILISCRYGIQQRFAMICFLQVFLRKEAKILKSFKAFSSVDMFPC